MCRYIKYLTNFFVDGLQWNDQTSLHHPHQNEVVELFCWVWQRVCISHCVHADMLLSRHNLLHFIGWRQNVVWKPADKMFELVGKMFARGRFSLYFVYLGRMLTKGHTGHCRSWSKLTKIPQREKLFGCCHVYRVNTSDITICNMLLSSARSPIQPVQTEIQ